MVVAPAIFGAVIPVPPQVALAGVVWLALAFSVDAHVVASTYAGGASISDVAFFAVAAEGAVCVGAVGLGVAVVDA